MRQTSVCFTYRIYAFQISFFFCSYIRGQCPSFHPVSGGSPHDLHSSRRHRADPWRADRAVATGTVGNATGRLFALCICIILAIIVLHLTDSGAINPSGDCLPMKRRGVAASGADRRPGMLTPRPAGVPCLSSVSYRGRSQGGGRRRSITSPWVIQFKLDNGILPNFNYLHYILCSWNEMAITEWKMTMKSDIDKYVRLFRCIKIVREWLNP